MSRPVLAHVCLNCLQYHTDQRYETCPRCDIPLSQWDDLDVGFMVNERWDRNIGWLVGLLFITAVVVAGLATYISGGTFYVDRGGGTAPTLRGSMIYELAVLLWLGCLLWIGSRLKKPNEDNVDDALQYAGYRPFPKKEAP